MGGIIFDIIMYLLFKKYDTSGEKRSREAVFIPFEDRVNVQEHEHTAPVEDYFPDDFNNA